MREDLYYSPALLIPRIALLLAKFVRIKETTKCVTTTFK